MLQAPLLDGLTFDSFSSFDDSFRPAEVSVGGCDVLQTFVIALVILVCDERFDLRFQVSGKEVVLQLDAVL